MMTKKIKLPTLPKVKYVEFETHKSAYFMLGEKSATPLVLCHGLAANGLQFVDDAYFFAEQGFRVIVPDLRGLGRSTKPKTITQEVFSIPNLASDLIAILDKEKIEKTHWVGNSLGGILALYIIDKMPERLNSLITFGTAYSLDVPEQVVPFLKSLQQMLPKDIMAWLGARTTCYDEYSQKIIHQMLLDADLEVVEMIAKNVRKYNFIKNAANFNKPILMIKGGRDILVNQALKPTLDIMKEKKNFTLIDIKKAGHCANLDEPKKVRQIILSFLTCGLERPS